MKRLITGAVLAAMASLLAIAAAACGSDSATIEDSASQASIDELAARVQRNQMLNAVITLAGLPMHEMDSAAQTGKIDNKFLPSTRTLVRVVALTEWSPELRADATKLHDDSVTLLQALDAGKDAAAIKPLSQSMHEDWHMFLESAWDVVAKDLPAGAGGPRAKPDDESTSVPNPTPMSHGDMTPGASDMH